MTERITKSMAKNIYYGGGMFALLIFFGLTFDTVQQIPKRSNEVSMSESVSCMEKHYGKKTTVWVAIQL